MVADHLPGPDTGINKVVFLNRRTGREAVIVSQAPYASEALRRYHVHPHPQFCPGDRHICYTTTVRGSIDVALVSVDALLALTGG